MKNVKDFFLIKNDLQDLLLPYFYIILRFC